MVGTLQPVVLVALQLPLTLSRSQDEIPNRVRPLRPPVVSIFTDGHGKRPQQAFRIFTRAGRREKQIPPSSPRRRLSLDIPFHRTLARKIASLTLNLWKKGERFNAQHLKPQAA
jgi:hypothetical protein